MAPHHWRPRSGAPRALAGALALCLAGCAVVMDNQPRNRPWAPAQADGRVASTTSALPQAGPLADETVVALSFSGGGARAAAFALGALHGLDTAPAGNGRSLLAHVGFITSVSGGSMTAAWVGLHGTGALDEFRRVALLRDSEQGLRASLLNPVNLLRLAAGGLNDRSTFQRWLDDEVFHGATFAQMSQPGRPVVWINATNLRQRIAFPFHQRAFDALCSDLASYPVAEAVAASMAVPLVFAPVVLEKHPEQCGGPLPDWVDSYSLAFGETMLAQSLLTALHDFRDTRTGRYVKLVDGGLTDNFGLTSIQQSRLLMGTPHAPFSEADALRVRRLLFLVVDGGRRPAVDWNRGVDGPGGLDLALAAIDAAIDTNVRLSYDSFLPMVRRWQDDVIRWRCALPAAVQQQQRDQRAHWRCDDVQFGITRIGFDDLGPQRAAALHAVSTRLSLPAADVDALIAAGREAVGANWQVRLFSQLLAAGG